jgi:2'-5' RNA ligase
MPRLFTGLEIPAATRTHLSLVRAPLSGAKWVEPENMHITLRFAGDIDDRTADEFAEALAEIRAEPFQVTIQGVGASGDATRACCGRAWRQASRWKRCIAPTSVRRAPPGWSPTRATSSRT